MNKGYVHDLAKEVMDQLEKKTLAVLSVDEPKKKQKQLSRFALRNGLEWTVAKDDQRVYVKKR